MSILFTCPHCGRQTNIDDRYGGRSGPCAGCGQTVTIPSRMPAPSITRPVAPPPKNGKSGTSSVVVVLLILGGVMLVSVLLCGGIIGAALILPAVQSARQAARNQQSSNNLKLIGLAIHNYHDVYKSLPLAGSEIPEYRIAQSWRVRLLPYIDGSTLFAKFSFNEPWDGPSNQPLIHQMPRIYQSPNVPDSDSKTVYLGVSENTPPGALRYQTGLNPPFRRDNRSMHFADFFDGLSNSILVVEANEDQAVIWSQPRDLAYDPQNPHSGLVSENRPGFMVLMGDGSVRFVSKNIDASNLRDAMLPNDGRPGNLD